jgi:hypothetical protein
MIFDPGQQISPKPDYTVVPDFNPVGLLLDELESMKRVKDCMKSRLSSSFTGAITEDFKHGVWQVTQGHAGLITSVCDGLRRSNVSLVLGFRLFIRHRLVYLSLNAPHIRTFVRIDILICIGIRVPTLFSKTLLGCSEGLVVLSSPEVSLEATRCRTLLPLEPSSKPSYRVADSSNHPLSIEVHNHRRSTIYGKLVGCMRNALETTPSTFSQQNFTNGKYMV